jgi:hypothetical protein
VPASYSIDPQQRLVLSRVWGIVTNDDVHDHDSRLRADPQADPTYRQLADMCDVTVNMVSNAVVQETAREQYFTPGTRRAFLVADDTNYGMCRMFATHAETLGQVINIFREREAAEAWLGLRD